VAAEDTPAAAGEEPAAAEDTPAAAAEEPAAAEDTPAAAAEEPAAAEEVSAVAAEAEIVLIEVWRPQRQHHNQRREHNRPRQHQRPAQNQNQGQNQNQNNGRETATENVASASPGPAQEHNQNRQNSRRNNFKRQYTPHMAEPAAVADASAQPTDATASAGQHDTRRDQRRDTPQGDGKGRQGRRNDDRRHGTFAKPEKAASRERAPDPNSPFAKLLILKQQMENQGGKS
jgi:ATP-dependent RNA helicase SUPV3L1/SUV3